MMYNNNDSAQQKSTKNIGSTKGHSRNRGLLQPKWFHSNCWSYFTDFHKQTFVSVIAHTSSYIIIPFWLLTGPDEWDRWQLLSFMMKTSWFTCILIPFTTVQKILNIGKYSYVSIADVPADNLISLTSTLFTHDGSYTSYLPKCMPNSECGIVC